VVRFCTVLAALGALASPACYRPSPQTGSPCADGAPCPSDLVCSLATLTCELASSDPDAPIGDDGAIDGAPVDLAQVVDVPPGTPCTGTFVVVCTTPKPTDTLQLTGTIDTTSDPRCVDGIASQANACTIVAGTIDVDGDLRVIGGRPLVLAAFDKLEVKQPIDVASHGTVTGAGANPTECEPGEAPATGFGGPGGSFGTQGGAGGTNVDPAPVQLAPMLRGGCPGAAGNPGGAGGHGGGALALIAGTELAIEATINASGAGGRGGTSGSGNGGGGGAGGMVILDAPTMIMSNEASVFANGGGGGSMAGILVGGMDGADPASWNVVATGGVSSLGGSGGNGYAGQVAATSGARSASLGAGAGGGGGGGVIRVVGGAVAPTTGMSPPPTP